MYTYDIMNSRYTTLLALIGVAVITLPSTFAQISSIKQQEVRIQEEQQRQLAAQEVPLVDLIAPEIIEWIDTFINEEWMRKFNKRYPELLETIDTHDSIEWRILWTVLTNYLQTQYPQLEQYHEQAEKKQQAQELQVINEAERTNELRQLEVQEVPDSSSNQDWYEYWDARIDQTQVRAARQSWVNTLRSSRSLPSIRFDKRLETTAIDRSEAMKNKWTADHRRTSSSSYYDYWQLVDRFEQYWIEFENIQRATFTENVGYATMRCHSGDCTEDAITSLRYVYEYFRNEEWQAYDAHRRTMIHPLFEIMGIWIAVDEWLWRIYITIHYWTSIK